ncbi:MAG: hypothetical protein K5755_02920 [Clostridiales bacterium]|nr:hypothetical protein [Clostridiales bacterium]
MKTRMIALAVLVCAVFSSCTVQTQFDVYSFVQRFNALSQDEILSTDDFLSDKENSLCAFFKIGESELLITLYENENSSLDGVSVTAAKSLYNENDLSEIINTVYRVFGAFNYGDTDRAKEKLMSVGFDGDFEPFYDEYRGETDEKYKITLYSDEYSFTVSQEKIPRD